MFEATLSSTLPDPQRLQRLTLAAAIALSVTASSIAGIWTLERMHIDRIGGPKSAPLELMQFSVLPPPKPPVSPPPTYGDETEQVSDPAPTSRAVRNERLDHTNDHASDHANPSPRGLASGGGEGPGIPTGPGCAPGMCGASLIPGTGTPCVRPTCTQPGLKGVAPAPAPGQVEFSALRCLVCADPDRDLLRKADVGSRKRSGTVGVRFCVDTRGHVEPGSIEISPSFGDAAVDRITRAAVGRWRFAPMKVAGQPHRACSRTQFDIRFN